jgi:YidC/Oxa1 family membrane protein insertase
MLAVNPLDPIIKGIAWLLAAIFDIVPPHDLGVSIILLTCLVMLALYPLTAKQVRSMISMQKVAPQIKKLQAEYKDDKQKQNEEVLKFYQENKINPLSGCLPLLAQMPVLISLFQVFRDPQKHIPKADERFGKLFTDLCPDSVDAGAKCTPKASFLGIDMFQSLSQKPAVPIIVLVALVVLASWYQSYQTIQRQKNTAGSESITQQMKIMTNIAPVMIGVFSINVPAGLPLYWLTSSAWRIGQQHFVLNKFYDDPEYKQIVSEAAKDRAKNGPAKASGGRGGRATRPAPKTEKPKPTSGRVTQPGKRPQNKKKR